MSALPERMLVHSPECFLMALGGLAWLLSSPDTPDRFTATTTTGLWRDGQVSHWATYLFAQSGSH